MERISSKLLETAKTESKHRLFQHPLFRGLAHITPLVGLAATLAFGRDAQAGGQGGHQLYLNNRDLLVGVECLSSWDSNNPNDWRKLRIWAYASDMILSRDMHDLPYFYLELGEKNGNKATIAFGTNKNDLNMLINGEASSFLPLVNSDYRIVQPLAYSITLLPHRDYYIAAFNSDVSSGIPQRRSYSGYVSFNFPWDCGETPTSTPTPTYTTTSTATRTASPTPTRTATPTSTATVTFTRTMTPIPTEAPQSNDLNDHQDEEQKPSPTSTKKPTQTPTPSPTSTNTPIKTPTFTVTPVATPTVETTSIDPEGDISDTHNLKLKAKIMKEYLARLRAKFH